MTMMTNTCDALPLMKNHIHIHIHTYIGVVPCLVAMMKDDNDDEHLRRLATACICNLSADAPLKVCTGTYIHASSVYAHV
jgi:hypothetical protein